MALKPFPLTPHIPFLSVTFYFLKPYAREYPLLRLRRWFSARKKSDLFNVDGNIFQKISEAETGIIPE